MSKNVDKRSHAFWINGVKYESNKLACDALGFKINSFRSARKLGVHKGYKIVEDYDKEEENIWKEELWIESKTERRTGLSLLKHGYMVHRLGVYNGQEV